MVQLMETSVKSGLEKIQHPKLKNKELLDLFTQLADGEEQQRQRCTERLISFLAAQERSSEEDICDDTKYSVRRLVQGLSSGRSNSRLGYSAALCQLLRSFEKVDNDMLFECINESAQSYGSKGSSKTMIRNACIGKVFAYLVLVQSKKLFNCGSQQISTVVQDLMKISTEKDYMPHLCTVAISQIISQIKRKVFQKYVLPYVEEKLTTGWSNCSPDDLLLVIHAKKHQPKAMESYLTEKWEDGNLISESTFSHVAEVVKKTTRLFPVIHSVIDTIVSEVIQQGLDLSLFWNTVAGPLFAGKSNDNTRSVGLYIFEKLIPHLNSPKQVEGILFPDITKQLTHHNKDAVTKVMTLVKSTDHGATQLSTLKCVVQHFEVPEFNLMNAMISHLVPEAMSSLSKELMKAYTLQPSWITDKKDMAPWSKWCVSSLNNLVTSGDDAAWQLGILQFLFIHSFFTVKKSSDIPHCTTLQGQQPDHVRTITGQQFSRAITRLLIHNKKSLSRSIQFNQHLDVLFQLAQYGQLLLQKTGCVQIESSCFNAEAAKQWTRMIEFLPTLQGKRSTSEKLGLDHAFELLFIYGGLQLFWDPSAVEFLQELHVCYKKSTQRRKSKANDEEPAWIEVVTELLLSLMFKGSVLSRNIAKTAMTTLAGHVTTDSLQLILDALQQKSLDDDEGMVGVEEDEEEDNEEDNDDSTLDKDEPADEDEDDDDDDSDSDDDSGVEEEAGIDVPDDVKSQIKEALGDAAMASDEDSSEDEELNDEEMFQLDEKLAEAFKAMSKTKNKKLDKERKEQMLQFKVRSCDLLDVIVKQNSSAHLIKEMIIPLLDRMEGGQRIEKEQVLGHKAKAIFDSIYKTKMVIPDSGLDKDELLELFSDLMKLSIKVSTESMMTEVVNGCVLVIRMMFNLQGISDPSPVKTRSKHKPGSTVTVNTQGPEVYQEKLVSLVLAGMMDVFKQKPGQGSYAFFCCLLKKNIMMLWPIWKGLVEVIGSVDIKTYSRASATSFLIRLLNKQIVRDLDSEDWNCFLTEIRSLSQKVLQTVGPKDKHFIKELLHLFLKINEVSPDKDIKILCDPEMKILKGMMSEFTHETMSLFRKVYRMFYKEELPQTKQKRKNSTKNGEPSSPKKKAKLKNQSVVSNGNLDSEESSISESIEGMDTEEKPTMNGVQKTKKKHKKELDEVNQINDSVTANTPNKSEHAVGNSPSVTSKHSETPTDPLLSASQKKKKKKKQRKSGEMVESQEADMEMDGDNLMETEDILKADDELSVSQSVNNVKSPASGKKKRKSDKFSPRYTRSMRP